MRLGRRPPPRDAPRRGNAPGPRAAHEGPGRGQRGRQERDADPAPIRILNALCGKVRAISRVETASRTLATTLQGTAMAKTALETAKQAAEMQTAILTSLADFSRQVDEYIKALGALEDEEEGTASQDSTDEK